MNQSTPKSAGLQIALILSFLLALILGVTVYMLYRENLELRQELELRKPQPAVSMHALSDSLLLSCSQSDSESVQLPFGLLQPAI